MKIKYIFICFALSFMSISNQTLAQNIGVTNLTFCGNSFKNIPIVNPVGFTSYSLLVPGNTTPYAYAPAIAKSGSFLPDSKLIFNTNSLQSGITVATILGYRSDNVAKVANNVITIDGLLNDGWVLDKNVFFANSGTNTPPASLFFNYRYDNNYIYFAGKVIDNSMSGSNDKVEIYLDAYNIDNSTLAGNYWTSIPLTEDSSKLKGARQIVIPMESFVNPGFRKQNTALIPSAYAWPNTNLSETRDTTGILCVVTTFIGESLPLYTSEGLSNPTIIFGKGYNFEIAIPFYNFFGFSPATTIDANTLAGYSFGFNMTSNNVSGQIFHSSTSASNGNSYQNTSAFGSLTFSATDPQAASTFIGTVTLDGIVLPPNNAAISGVGECQSELTVTGVVTSIAGAESYWQVNENSTSTAEPLSSPKIFTNPITQKEVFINTLYLNGCWSKTSTLEIKPKSIVSILDSVKVFYPTCGFAAFNLSTSGVSSRRYYWQTNNTITSTSISASNTYTVSGNTLQSVYLRAQNTVTGCWSDSLMTSATPNTIPANNPNANLLKSISGACVGKTALVYYTNTAPGNTMWYWQTELNGTTTGMANDTITVTTSGTAYIRAQKFGCWSNASVGIPVDLSDIVIPAPSTKNYTYFQNDATTALALASVNTLYGINWYVDVQTATPVQVAPTPTSTEIGLKNYFAAYTKDNCESSKSPITVEVKELVIIKPSKYYGITPNNAGAVENEKFEIENISRVAGNKVIITDKWGNIVYEKENYDNSFDGKNNSGKDLPFGSYLYIVNLNNGQAPFTGTIVITR